MITFVLIIFAISGPARGVPVSLDHIGGFHSYQQCEAAGAAAVEMTMRTMKDIKFTCVVQGPER